MPERQKTMAIIVCGRGFFGSGSSHHYCRFPKRVSYFHAFVISAEPHVISISLQKQKNKTRRCFVRETKIIISLLFPSCGFASLASSVVLWASIFTILSVLD